MSNGKGARVRPLGADEMVRIVGGADVDTPDCGYFITSVVVAVWRWVVANAPASSYAYGKVGYAS